MGAVGVINSHTETRGSLLLFYVLCFHKLSSPLSVAAAPGPAEGKTFALILFKETDFPTKLTKDIPPLSLDTPVHCVCF